MLKRTQVVFIILVLAYIFSSISCDLLNGILDSTGTITGKVTFSNSSDHAGIVISLESKEGEITKSVSHALQGDTRSLTSRSLSDQTTTNSNGEYQFIDVPEGDYTLYASSQDSSEKAVYTSIHIDKGKTVTAPDLQLTSVGSIHGRIVLDGTATGNIGFIIFIADTSYMAITGNEGNFTISEVPSGNDYDLVIMRGTDTYSWDNVSVSAGSITELGTKYLLSEDFPGSITIAWQGSLDAPPVNPELYWAYYNMTDGVSYLYTGNGEWQVLAQNGEDGSAGETGAAGADGISIIWKGGYANVADMLAALGVTKPEENWAYYNSTDGISYIYDGSDWNILAQDGSDGADAISIIWLGEYSSAPSGASLNNAYYNTSNGNSYIYNGSYWDLLAQAGSDGADGETGATGAAGADGISIIWKGELTEAPSSPEVNWAYYNSTDGISYIYNGSDWNILAQDGADGSDGVDGADGADGVSIVWLGEYSSAPSGASLNNAYYNTSDGNSYIYNGSSWDLLAAAGADGVDGATGADGADGISIIWKGELTEAPISPEVNWAYYNSTVGISYTYDGSQWNILAQDGSDGADAISIVWLGEFSSEPSGASLNNTYYNTSDGNSYIYNGSSWDLLAAAGADGADGETGAAGADGISIIWKGELSDAPSDPTNNWAYYNIVDGISYIYDGSDWNILAQDGSDGVDAISIVWLGESSSAPSGSSLNNAYYNTSDGNSYIYNGSDWDLLAAAGADGADGETGASGTDGISIIWKGELSSAPNSPGVNWAYYNSSDKKAWIWSNNSWNLLVNDGNSLLYISFYNNNATSGYLPETIFGYEGDQYGVPQNSRGLEKVGYSFSGWNSKSDGSGDDYILGSYYMFSNESLRLYAQWTPNNYKIYLNVQGGDLLENDSLVVTYDSFYGDLPTPTRAGYNFDTWWIDTEITSTTIVKIPYNHVIDAHWIPRTDTKYLVEHYQQDVSGDGYTLVDSDILTGTTEATATAEVKAYTGFHENPIHELRVSSGEIRGNGSLVLKLYYDRDNFTVSFKSNCNSIVDDIEGVRYQATISEPELLTKIGYTFNYWYKDIFSWTPFNFSSAQITSDLILTANWSANTDTQYKVEHYQQDISGPGYTLFETEYLTGTTDSEALAYSKFYYYFRNTNDDISIYRSNIYGDGSLVLKIYYYRNTYTISYNSNGGSIIEDMEARYDSTLNEPIPTREGYTFSGWFKDDDLTTTWDFSSEKIERDISLYAKWTADEHTLYLLPNGGIGTMDSITIKTNEKIQLPICRYTQEEFGFYGWSETSQGEVDYSDEGFFTMGPTDAELYAIWGPFAVGFRGQAGGYIFYDDEADGVDNIPGYRFLELAPFGWYDTDGDGEYWEDPDPRLFQWGVNGYYITPNGTAPEIGAGLTNTINIVNFHNNLGTEGYIGYDEGWGSFYENPQNYFRMNDGSVIAKICTDAVINGYDDWYLPSIDELKEVSKQLYSNGKDNFVELWYRSSTENSTTTVKSIWMEYDVINEYTELSHGMFKYFDLYPFRPIRYF